MAELFGPRKEENTVSRVRIDDMEPGVFKTLLHFIYTGSLPDDDEMYEGSDKVAMAQGLLVAADRY
ncbi:hypothetical protein U9M48_001574 [Paspalum notatum var. saurae]|uniref:BTB domain-containing protein n=1 Tax=Paspalum notatum var. saurae TaxID=547442 RepID=A0AAQ3PM86_PASNO